MDIFWENTIKTFRPWHYHISQESCQNHAEKLVKSKNGNSTSGNHMQHCKKTGH